MAVLINITVNGQSGNYLADIDPGVDDFAIKRLCEEVIRNGEVSGLPTDLPAEPFRYYVIDRFHDGQFRFILRPKVPFGSPL